MEHTVYILQIIIKARGFTQYILYCNLQIIKARGFTKYKKLFSSITLIIKSAIQCRFLRCNSSHQSRILENCGFISLQNILKIGITFW